ncbi:MAG: formyltransferase family protein [Burkholderiaceae bacterium]|nr:formyltransferase family protein [Burkholderiaceae bacterium]MDZ4143684.1 formyltransferase family protein [Burkholderiales bacterium]
MKLIIFLLGEKGLNVVRALFNSPIELSIFCVIGRDNSISNDYSTEITAYCNANSIEYSFKENITYDAKNYDFAFAIGWRWIIRDFPEKKLIILHDSLLPRYRGFSPLVNALLNKEKEVGVSAIFGASEYDRGNIIMQRSMHVTYPTSLIAELEKIVILYAELAIAVVSKLINEGNLFAGSLQNENDASYSLWRDDEDYRINWNDSASTIDHFINCVGHPYLGAATKLNGKIIRIFQAKVIDDVKIENRSPGKVIFMKDEFPIVVCGQGLLMIKNAKNGDGQSALPLNSFRSRFK